MKKTRFKNIAGYNPHVSNVLIDCFLKKIFSNICKQSKDQEVCKNLLSIGIEVKKISPVTDDIWIDGIDFDNSRIRNNYVLLDTIMDKVITVVKFVYSIPDDSILEICLIESKRASSGEPYLLFKITGDGVHMVLNSFPMMKTGAFYLAQEITSLVEKDMESMIDELSGDIPRERNTEKALESCMFRDIHDLIDDGYRLHGSFSTGLFKEFENKVDSEENRLAMKEYLKSITPVSLLTEIGVKKYTDGNSYNVVFKRKADSDINTKSENNDEFEIVLKFKKPIGLGYHSSTETTESPDVFDIRADFISKYPELKENVSIARKVDKQGDISDIMEQKLRYDAVAATATYMLHKNNPFLSSLMNLEIDDESKTEIGYAITRCRNSIVKESKK